MFACFYIFACYSMWFAVGPSSEGGGRNVWKEGGRCESGGVPLQNLPFGCPH